MISPYISRISGYFGEVSRPTIILYKENNSARRKISPAPVTYGTDLEAAHAILTLGAAS
jgi:hypothetical protein